MLQGFWALLYIIEVMAIVSVLNKYPDQETAVSNALRATMGLRYFSVKPSIILSAVNARMCM